MNLSRVFINLQCTDGSLINYNYNYKLLKVLYESYSLQNREKARIFHKDGFKLDNKNFKLIDACLTFNKVEFGYEGIKINKESIINIMISGISEVLNEIVKGLIKMDSIKFGNCIFKTGEIYGDKKIYFKKTMLYKVLTTVVESRWSEGKTIYLTPYQSEFYEALAQNLKRKYKLIYDEVFTDELYFDIENILNVKKKEINNIKGNGYIKGYGNFNIWIQTNKKMQQVVYYCGLGQSNLLGAGTLVYLTNR